MSAVRGLAEVVLMVQDVDRSLAFYRDVLGLTVISPDLKGPVFLRVGESRAGVPQQIVLVPRPPGVSAPNQERARTLHHLGLEVPIAALDEERRRLQGMGFEVRTGRHPFLPVEAIYVDDPDGNEIELVAARG